MSKVAELLNKLHQQAQHDISITGPSAIGGRVCVQGSKNTANKLIAVTVARPGRYEIQNIPFIIDPLELLAIVERLGGEVKVQKDHTVIIDTTHLASRPIPYELTKSTTGAFGFAGALLGRFGQMRVGRPGGDEIGLRPIALHIAGFRALGATITENHNELDGQLSTTLAGQHFRLQVPSTGAAVNFLLTVAGANGKATLENAPIDSDIVAMCDLLRATGVNIAISDHTMQIDATSTNSVAWPIVFTCPPDRNDAFTWLAYGALSQDGLTVTGLTVADIKPGVEVLKSLGVRMTQPDATSLFVQAPLLGRAHNRENIIAGLAREFHSDWAPLLEVVLTTIPGRCRIIDTVFSHRIRQAELLQDMSARISIAGGLPPPGVKLHFTQDPHDARYITSIQGISQLQSITAAVGNDVRACAAAVMAASLANGTSTFSQVKALYRGYDNIVDRLRSVGVDITTSIR